MTYGLDTSVAARIVTGMPQNLAEAVQQRLCELLEDGNDFIISDLVIAELYFALQRHYSKTKDEAIRAICALADEPGFAISSESRAALNTPNAWKANPGVVDRMIANEYASRGCVTLSCEKSFRRLDLTEVIK